MDINLLKTSLPITSLGAGVKPQAGADQVGGLLASELAPRYSFLTYNRAVFNAANQAGQVTTVGLATTYTGLCLSNPVGSLVNIHMLKVGASFVVAFAAGSFVGLMTGYNSATNVTHTVAITPRNNFFGPGASPVGLVDSSATLPTAPFVTHIFGSGLTGAITTTPQGPQYFIDLEGSLILPPGAYCAIYTSTVSGAAGMIASMSWAELPV